jgi:type IV fimbrial biogenesis protein FimT
MKCQASHRGFSLVEFMVTVVVIAILAAAAFPSMTDFFDRKRLVSQTEAIANLIQFARSEAIKHPTSTNANLVSASVNPGTPWSVGLSNGTAGCTDAATCVLSQSGTNITRYITATECTGCTMSAPANQQIIVFDLRGLVSTGSAEITLQSPLGKKLAVSLSTIGRVTLCSPDGTLSGYPSTCPNL